jgi:hypothetical protein
VQRAPADRQQFTTPSVCKEAAEADPHKAARQGVKQEPSEELFGGHRYQPLLILVSVILPAESDLAVVKVHDPVVGNGDAVRVAGQIVKDMFRPSERSFGIDKPSPYGTVFAGKQGRLSVRRTVSGFRGKATSVGGRRS